MVRKIKRLADRPDRFVSIDQQMGRDPEAWRKKLEWWHNLGINTGLLLTLLEGTRVARSLFEEELEARVDSLTTWNIRRARSALKRAEPLIRLLKTEVALDGPPDLFFGDLGEQIERSVKNYIAVLRCPALPAHHPGEPWLREKVLLLARLLLACNQSWKRTVRAIHELFELAGHGDVTTVEKIRHYIRAERRRDPKFGVGHAARVGPWFAKTRAWRSTPNDLGEQRRSGRPRPRGRPSAPARKKRR